MITRNKAKETLKEVTWGDDCSPSGVSVMLFRDNEIDGIIDALESAGMEFAPEEQEPRHA
jgi:hypothetical protein